MSVLFSFSIRVEEAVYSLVWCSVGKSLSIIYHILYFQKQNNIRIEFEWKKLWTTLINTLKFLESNSLLIPASSEQDAGRGEVAHMNSYPHRTHKLIHSAGFLSSFDICNKILKIFDLFITKGTFVI